MKIKNIIALFILLALSSAFCFAETEKPDKPMTQEELRAKNAKYESFIATDKEVQEYRVQVNGELWIKTERSDVSDISDNHDLIYTFLFILASVNIIMFMLILKLFLNTKKWNS